MKRISVSMPDQLHELILELARRKNTSASTLILAAIEDAYEDEIDAVAGEIAHDEYLRDPSSAIAFDEYIRRRRGREQAP